MTIDYHTLLFGAMAILIGFQSITFAVFTKLFGITEHLLPEELDLTKLFRYVTLEIGLILGALLIFAGAGIGVFGLNYWRSHDFCPLDPEKSLRIVIPGFVALTLGIQIVLSNFFSERPRHRPEVNS